MRLSIALACATLLIAGCSRQEEQARSRLEQAQEKLETGLAEGTAEAKKALAIARKHWDEFQPEAEKAVASLEQRVEKLVNDSEALERLPPEALERIRAHLDAMRVKLAEAKAAHEQGNTDLAVEKADAVEQERAAAEEWLVERPDPPAHGREVR